MKKSIGKASFYDHFISELNKDIESKKQRLFELRNSRIRLMNVIEDKKFNDAYVILSGYDPVEYMAYFYRIKDMQRNFKLDELKVVNKDNLIHTHSMFLKASIYNIMKYNRAIKDTEDILEELESCIISYDIYKAILDTHDNLLARYLLDGKRYSIGSGIGTIYITEKDRNYKKKVINHEASNRERKRLIAEGLIPFKKEEYEKALVEGREYNGVEWLIYFYDEKSYWLHWKKSRFIKNIILYSLTPTHANNTDQSIYELQDTIKFENIPNYKIGFEQMIHLCRRMNPDQTRLYRNNTITV